MPYGKSPNEMGHSPAEMESAKQEKYNLLHDNPVAKHASKGSWMSKHSKSALHMGHSPAEMGHSPAEMGHSPLEKHGGFHAVDAAKVLAGATIKTAKKVKAAGSKIAKAVSADLFEGGFERKRKLRADRGGAKPAKLFKK